MASHTTATDPRLSGRYGKALAFLSAFLIALVPFTSVQGQYFGRNKVLWEKFDFSVLETNHFRIYHYPPRAASADEVARLAERWYTRLASVFEHEFEKPNPLFIYQDDTDFQQTLTTSGLIGEGVGGFTESLQNRIVLPLTGVHADDDHVIGHEMVHAFQFDLMKAAAEPGSPSQAPALPQWLAEGLAEYLSQGREDAQTAMWIRDAVLHDALPDPKKMRRLELSPYQYGQAVWAYIAGRWGDRAAVRLFTQAAGKGFNAAARAELGVEPEALLADVHESLREAYAPVLDARREPGESARAVLEPGHTGARLNIAPSLSPDGMRLAFLASRELFSIDLFLADAVTGKVTEKLVSADADPHFDSLSFVDSSVTWSPDGRRLAFTVFAKGERQLALFDVDEGRIERRLPAGSIKGIRNPCWSPDGRSLAFSGTVDGTSNLYRVDVDTGAIAQLTDDPYTAIQPAFSPDGRSIVFVTDRGPDTNLAEQRFGALKLALLDLETGRTQVLSTFAHGKHIDPHFASDGQSIYFIAEPDGVADVFRYHLLQRTTDRLTAVKTGVTGITAESPALSVAVDSDDIAFSVLEDGGFNIYRLDVDAQVPLEEPGFVGHAASLPPPEVEPGLVETYLQSPGVVREGQLEVARHAYEPRLKLASLGPATAEVSADSYGTGVGGSMSAYFTDPLGTRQLASTLYGGTWGGSLDFENAIGGETVYLNQSRHLQWGVIGSRLPDLSGGTFLSRGSVDIDGTAVPATFVDNVLDVVTTSEIGAFTQYPFSLNRRMEASVGISHVGFKRTLERLVVPEGATAYLQRSDLASPPSIDLYHASTAFVIDTSRFGFVSPLRGRRFRVEAERTDGDLSFNTALLDYRHYFYRDPWTFAIRVMHVARFGENAEDLRLWPLDVGRDTLVRGYELGTFDLSECTLSPGSTACPEFERLLGSRIAVLNFEARLPVLGNRDLGLFRAPAFPMEAVAFIDIGAAWTSTEKVDWKFERHTTERVPVVSMGIAARFLIGGILPLQVYYAAPFERPREGRTLGIVVATGW